MDFTGDDIRAARERAHMTQQELGEAVGVSLRTVGNWERGESVPRSRMGALVEVLNLGEPTPQKKFPTDGIQNLILNKKGERSYDRLARDCGHGIKSRALHATATKPTRAFADPDTIRGLSRGLNTPVSDIIRAYAISLGLPIAEDEKGVLRVIGGANLPDSSQNLIISMARELQDAWEPATGDPADYDLAAYDTGEESEGDRIRREQDEAGEAPEDDI